MRCYGFGPPGKGLLSQACGQQEHWRRLDLGPAPSSSPVPGPSPRPKFFASSAACGHVASQRPGHRVAQPDSCPRPAPRLGPRPWPKREEKRGEGRALAQAAAPALQPAGRPSRPAPTCGARGLPKPPAARPKQRDPHRPTAAAPARPPTSPVGGTRQPRRESGGRAFAARNQSSRAATHIGRTAERAVEATNRQREVRGAAARGPIARPHGRDQGAEAGAALTVAAGAGLGARRAAAAGSAGSGERGACRE